MLHSGPIYFRFYNYVYLLSAYSVNSYDRRFRPARPANLRETFLMHNQCKLFFWCYDVR